MNEPIKWEVSIAFLVAVNNEAEIVEEQLRDLSNTSGGGIDENDGDCTIYYIKFNSILLKAIYSKCPKPYQGGDPAAWQTALLINNYRPDCLIMLGMCAGNKQEGLDIGDVVISGTVYRHDYGKIIRDSGDLWPRFEARGAQDGKSVNDKLIQKILSKLPKKISKHAEGFGIKIGVISTGYQLIKLTDAHEIISKNLSIKTAGGDGHNRTMLGIDMEAYSVAYASEKGKCDWIIIKGVSDFGEPGSNIDGGARKAVTNAFSTTISVIQEAVIPLFIQEAGKDAMSKAEGAALEAYYSGDIDNEISIAEEAFQKGVRSVKIRRRLLHGLVESDRFDEAKQICNYLQSTNLLYDGDTAEYVAQMLSRKGKHSEALELVNNFMGNNNETIHLLYIGASSSYQIAERTTIHSPDSLISNWHFKNSISLIEKAVKLMEEESKQMPWVYIFGYFLYEIEANYNHGTEICNNASNLKTKANAVLSHMTLNHPDLAAIRFHRLLFFAITNDKPSFDEFISDNHGGSVSWTRLDSAFMRLNSLLKHSILNKEQFNHYWGGLCQWVAQKAPRYGRPAQSITNAHLI